MTRTTKIDSNQLVVLLVLSKIFLLLTVSSQLGAPIMGYVEMLAFAISTVIQFILLIPAFILLKKNQDCGIIECAFKVNPVYGKIVALLFLLILLLQNANAVSHFEYFMTTSVYPQATSFVFVLFFVIAIAYSVYMGLEAFSRLAGFVLVGAVIGTIFLIASVTGAMDMVYVHNPLSDGVKVLMEAVWTQVTISMELMVMLLLAPYVTGDLKKPMVKYFVITMIYFEAITFAVMTSLGSLAKNELFPVFTMAIISEMSFLERLDTLYMAMWIFIAFIRNSTIFFLSVDLLKFLLPNKIASKGILINGVIVFAVSMYFSNSIYALAQFSGFVQLGIPLGLYVVAIPTLTLFLTRKKSEVSV